MGRLSIARARLVAGSGRMSRLGAAHGSGHHDLMEQIEVSESSKLPNQTDLGTSNSLVSELIPAYLEYVRVERDRAVVTVERYRARLQRFIEEMGDCRISEITSEKLVLYKRRSAAFFPACEDSYGT